MRYFVTFEDGELPVDVNVLPAGGYEVMLDGRRIEADVLALGDALSVRVGHRVLDLTVDGKLPLLNVVGAGHRTRLKVESERMRLGASRSSRAPRSDNVVASPMPGRIVKVLVQPGAQVESGQPVVVVEAMKMENELRAPRAATVGKVLVQVGDRVEGGAPLVELS